MRLVTVTSSSNLEAHVAMAISLAHLNNAMITKKDELQDVVLEILGFDTTKGSVEDPDGKRREIPSWRVRARRHDDGEYIVFLMGRNNQRDVQFENARRILEANPGEFALGRLVTKAIESKAKDRMTGRVVGSTDMWEIEFIEA